MWTDGITLHPVCTLTFLCTNSTLDLQVLERCVAESFYQRRWDPDALMYKRRISEPSLKTYACERQIEIEVWSPTLVIKRSQMHAFLKYMDSVVEDMIKEFSDELSPIVDYVHGQARFEAHSVPYRISPWTGAHKAA